MASSSLLGSAARTALASPTRSTCSSALARTHGCPSCFLLTSPPPGWECHLGTSREGAGHGDNATGPRGGPPLRHKPRASSADLRQGSFLFSSFSPAAARSQLPVRWIQVILPLAPQIFQHLLLVPPGLAQEKETLGTIPASLPFHAPVSESRSAEHPSFSHPLCTLVPGLITQMPPGISSGYSHQKQRRKKVKLH